MTKDLGRPEEARTSTSLMLYSETYFDVVGWVTRRKHDLLLSASSRGSRMRTGKSCAGERLESNLVGRDYRLGTSDLEASFANPAP